LLTRPHLQLRTYVIKGAREQPKLDEKGFKKELAKSILYSLIRNFPDETMEVITNYTSTRAK